jgi:hypothetical protein
VKNAVTVESGPASPYGYHGAFVCRAATAEGRWEGSKQITYFLRDVVEWHLGRRSGCG